MQNSNSGGMDRAALRGIRVPGDAPHGPEHDTGSSWEGVRYLVKHHRLGIEDGHRIVHDHGQRHH